MKYLTTYEDFRLLLEAENNAIVKYVSSQLMDMHTFSTLKTIDFTGGKLLDSICRFYVDLIEHRLNLKETVDTLKKYLDIFRRFVNKKNDFKDISLNLFDYKTFDQLKEVIDQNEVRLYSSYPKKLPEPEAKYEILQNDDNFFSVRLGNLKANIYFGNYCGWCVTDPDYWGMNRVVDSYSRYARDKKGTFYYFFDKKMDKRDKLQKLLLSVFPGDKSYELRGISNEPHGEVLGPTYIEYLKKRGVDTKDIINIGTKAIDMSKFTQDQKDFINLMGWDAETVGIDNGYLTQNKWSFLQQGDVDVFFDYVHSDKNIKVKLIGHMPLINIHQIIEDNFIFLNHENISVPPDTAIMINDCKNLLTLKGIPEKLCQIEINNCENLYSLKGLDITNIKHVDLTDLPKLYDMGEFKKNNNKLLSTVTILNCPNIERYSHIPKSEKGPDISMSHFNSTHIFDNIIIPDKKLQEELFTAFRFQFTLNNELMISDGKTLEYDFIRSMKYIESDRSKYFNINTMNKYIEDGITGKQILLLKKFFDLTNVRLNFYSNDWFLIFKDINDNSIGEYNSFNRLDALSNGIRMRHAIIDSPHLTKIDMISDPKFLINRIHNCNNLKNANFCFSTVNQPTPSKRRLEISLCPNLKTLNIRTFPDPVPIFDNKINLVVDDITAKKLIITKKLINNLKIFCYVDDEEKYHVYNFGDTTGRMTDEKLLAEFNKDIYTVAEVLNILKNREELDDGNFLI